MIILYSDLNKQEMPLSLTQSPVLNMPANLEISAVATGLKKVSFHSNPKERQCQRISQITAQLHSSHTLVK